MIINIYINPQCISVLTLEVTWYVPWSDLEELLNYLFLYIPDLSDHFIKRMEQLFFEFIWDNKPDKIKRNTLCMDYSGGGGGGGVKNVRH